MDLPILDTSYKWSHTICGLLPMASFIYYVFKFHPYCDQSFTPVLVRVLQRSRTNWMHTHTHTHIHTHTHTQIYFKELTHMSMEAGKFRICRMGQQTGNPGRASVAVQVQRLPAGRVVSCSGEVSLLFYSGLQLIGWNLPTLWKGNVNLMPKHPRKIHDNIWPNIWALWPSQIDT